MLGDLIGTLSNYLYTYILVILLIAAGCTSPSDAFCPVPYGAGVYRDGG